MHLPLKYNILKQMTYKIDIFCFKKKINYINKISTRMEKANPPHIH